MKRAPSYAPARAARHARLFRQTGRSGLRRRAAPAHDAGKAKPAIFAAVLGVILLTPQAAVAAAQDQAQVVAAVRLAAAAAAPGAGITLGPVQGVAFMPACTTKLAVTITGTEPYEQADVHCGAPVWTLYVTVTVAATQAVIVAARPIAAGQPLSAADLRSATEPDTLYAGRQVFYDPAPLIGATAVMNLPPGLIITQNDINEPVIVTAGQTVAVNVSSGGVNVSINAVADQTGRVGDTILLTNPSSGKRFSARVTPDGLQVDF